MHRGRGWVCWGLALGLLAGAMAASWGAGVDPSRADALAKLRALQARRITAAERLAAAQGVKPQAAVPQAVPGGKPNYFGPEGNFAYSPVMRKFVDLLPGLTAAGANNLGQYLPVAVPDTTTYPGSDYYEIELRQWKEKMHSDLPPTTLRGYVQVKNGVDVAPPHYLGPAIVAQKNRPVRIKFTNKLPLTGNGGGLFLPVDTTIMGSGMGPLFMGGMQQSYSQNRATLHLHGGLTPWISDGTPHQWTTPAGEDTVYPKGLSVANVPDMPAPGPGSLTFFYSNQQSARLMFYHDHAYGLTRLNVYAGEAAPYVLRDNTEQALITQGVLPSAEIPLVIQDKTFVPGDLKLAATDPTWDKTKWGAMGNLWFPHVYMPAENPNDPSGVNAVGRWAYGPWEPDDPAFVANHPPFTDGQGVEQPGVPDISTVPEAFMDTPVINGTAYPICRVERKAYRFRVLNACNDRSLNLGLYFAKSNTPDTVDGTTGLPTFQTKSGEVNMVPFDDDNVQWPATWGEPDDRPEGIPDPGSIGPPIIQIGNEGGFLPAPTVIPSTPIFYDQEPESVTYGDVKEHGLFLGPAERADIIVDFALVPAGSRLILYNDSPAPAPGGDPLYDLYTRDPDLSSAGGAPSTRSGYGPNTRTLMQFEVSGTPAPVFSQAALNAAFASTATQKGVFAHSQDSVLVPQVGYNSAYNASYPDDEEAYAGFLSLVQTFTPRGAPEPITIGIRPKSIVEGYEKEYGRITAVLGVESPPTESGERTAIGFGYIDPVTEFLGDSKVAGPPQAGDYTQIWRITQNGEDTHAVHFHLFNVQVLNRVDWSGVVKPPDPNELGWKETVRMNPGEDTIVALRPIAPRTPFGVPVSIRPLDVASSIGSTGQFSPVDANGNPVTTVNEETRFAWEYVWHCHLLGHEENDMMRAMSLYVATKMPEAPVLGGVRDGTRRQAFLTWTDGTPAATALGKSANEVGFKILRSYNGRPFTEVGTALANQTSFTDTGLDPTRAYSYKVIAFNASGKVFSNTKLVS